MKATLLLLLACGLTLSAARDIQTGTRILLADAEAASGTTTFPYHQCTIKTGSPCFFTGPTVTSIPGGKSFCFKAVCPGCAGQPNPKCCSALEDGILKVVFDIQYGCLPAVKEFFKFITYNGVDRGANYFINDITDLSTGVSRTWIRVTAIDETSEEFDGTTICIKSAAPCDTVEDLFVLTSAGFPKIALMDTTDGANGCCTSRYGSFPPPPKAPLTPVSKPSPPPPRKPSSPKVPGAPKYPKAPGTPASPPPPRKPSAPKAPLTPVSKPSPPPPRKPSSPGVPDTPPPPPPPAPECQYLCVTWTVTNQVSDLALCEKLADVLNDYASIDMGMTMEEDFACTETTATEVTVCGMFETEIDASSVLASLEFNDLEDEIAPAIGFGSGYEIVDGKRTCMPSELYAYTSDDGSEATICDDFSIESPCKSIGNNFPYCKCHTGMQPEVPYSLTYSNSYALLGSTVYCFDISADTSACSGRCCDMNLDKIEFLSLPECSHSVDLYWIDDGTKYRPAWARQYDGKYGAETATIKFNRLGLDATTADGAKFCFSVKAGSVCPDLQSVCLEGDTAGCKYAVFDETNVCCAEEWISAD